MNKKFNKKFLLFGVLGFFALALISAGILIYYGQINQSYDVEQAVVLTGDGCNNNFCEDNVGQVYSPDTRLSGLYVLTNNDPEKSRDVKVVRTSCGTAGCDGITTTYVKPKITDDNANFGSSNNEVFDFDYTGLTLNDLFAGDGLKYEYNVLEGGQWAGASPVIVVIDLSDGRHIALFPGWGARTGIYTLQYSETVAFDTGGNNYVDFALYPNDFSSWLYGSVSCGYGDFEAVKSDTTLIDGNELVTRVSIQHQGANTGQEDQIESMLVNGVNYVFIEKNSGDQFPVSSLDPKLGFMVKNDFVTSGTETYIITTEAQPVTA